MAAAASCQIVQTMFESAELLHPVAKSSYLQEVEQLRAALLNAQYDLKLNGRFAVLILIAGETALEH